MHSIVFKNAESDWNEALPLGNGIFGGMGYFRKNTYQLALNHYEVYYTLYHRYSHGFLEDPRPVRPGVYRSRYQETKAAAEKNRPRSGEDPYLHYRRTIWPTADLPRQAELQNGVGHPPTGEAAFHLGEALAEAEDFSLRLDIEDAALRLRVRKGQAVLSAETVVLSDADAALTRISQSEAGLLESLTLGYPQRRNHEGFAVSWEQKAPDTFLCRVSFYPEGEDREKYPPFSFAVVHRLMGAEGEGAVEGTAMNVRILRAGKKVSLLSYVLTELSAPEELEQTALAAAEKLAAALPERLEAHRAYWKEFFSRSRIALPDPVVERLWYLNLYVLRCSSGRGGKRFEQASGLNGLWDIRQPTMWGSLWYWDVNIEASYWPVYTANHLELAEVFNDGFLSYVPEAERRAREYYEMRGCAMDYPHTFYNCMWPWCAQYLWWYYEYSGDRDFLRERAYPLFRSLALFIEDVMEWDPETGTWGFFPDVSPEQGPITRNSTITLATVKYLLKIALKANGILKAGEEDAALFRKLLERVPPYSTAVLDRYGQVLKDSEYAPARIRLRHPSLLMPIFPLSELGPDSELARNTVFFASENTEIGVFPFGWISAAAARLGMGNTALRVLYEQGIDLIVRNNGMGAEETERWVNHCIVDSGHFYQPFMMECVGETVNCVNEMLLQSYDGVIRVFPAVPNGDPETFRFRGAQIPDYDPWKNDPPVHWRSCGFDGFLAKDGFEVSARMEAGKPCWIQLRSLRGGEAALQLPDSLAGKPVLFGEEPVSAKAEAGILRFETVPGGVYTLGELPEERRLPEEDVLCYRTHLERKNFIGKTENTEVFKAMDSFLCDYYVANDRYRPILAYRFNFGVPFPELPQDAPGSRKDLSFIRITPEERWCSRLGFGFAGGAVQAADTGEGEYLLRDGVFGSEAVEFLVDLPKGRYDLLAVSGNGKFSTRLSVNGQSVRMDTAPGRYRAEILPVVHKGEGPLTLHISAAEGAWQLSLLVIRKVQAFL